MIAAQGDQYIFTLDNTTLITSYIEYPGINDFTYDFPYDDTISISEEAFSVPFEVNALVLSYSQMISDAELSEYSQKFGSENPLIGNELRNDKEIIISEYMLSKYGFTLEQAENLIGQKISIEMSDGEENKPLFDEYTLVGIIRSDFFRISSRKYSPHFIVPFSDTLFTAQGGQDVDTLSFTTIVNSLSYSDAIRANESLLQYGKSISLSSTAAIYADTEMQQILYNKIILLVAVLLVFAVIVFVYSIVSYYFKMRNSYIGLQRAVGMKSGQVFSVFLCEFLMMSTISLAISLPSSFALMAALRAFILQTLGYSMTVSLKDLGSAALMGGIFVIIVSLLISYVEFLKTKKMSIIESLMDN
jgi:ABC-type antimicrobial peptide transport system permease subunit